MNKEDLFKELDPVKIVSIGENGKNVYDAFLIKEDSSFFIDLSLGKIPLSYEEVSEGFKKATKSIHEDNEILELEYLQTSNITWKISNFFRENNLLPLFDSILNSRSYLFNEDDVLTVVGEGFELREAEIFLLDVAYYESKDSSFVRMKENLVFEEEYKMDSFSGELVFETKGKLFSIKIYKGEPVSLDVLSEEKYFDLMQLQELDKEDAINKFNKKLQTSSVVNMFEDFF